MFAWPTESTCGSSGGSSVLAQSLCSAAPKTSISPRVSSKLQIKTCCDRDLLLAEITLSCYRLGSEGPHSSPHGLCVACPAATACAPSAQLLPQLPPVSALPSFCSPAHWTGAELASMQDRSKACPGWCSRMCILGTFGLY